MGPASRRKETLQAVLVVILAALILRQFVVAAYKIPSRSMENTLLVGDFLLVNKFIYGPRLPEWIGIPFTRESDWLIPTGWQVPENYRYRFPAIADPQAGDVVVFHYPLNPRIDYIKRCIVTGGHQVSVVDRDVFVDGQRMALPPTARFDDARDGLREDMAPVVVDSAHYFMMGDYRDASLDSRAWGFVPHRYVVGKPLMIYLSLNDDEDGRSFLEKIRWRRLGMVVR